MAKVTLSAKKQVVAPREARGGLGTEIAVLFSKVDSVAEISGVRGRTTVTLNDEVAAMAKRYAKGRGLPLSEAIAELIVRATRKSRIKYVDGLPVFDLPKSKQRLTSKQVKALEAS
jgi:hypothetical protein